MITIPKKFGLITLFVSSFISSNNANADVHPVTMKDVLKGVGAAASVGWLYSREIKQEENKTTITKALDLGTRSLHAPVDFFDKHKNTLTLSAVAGAIVCFGPNEMLQKDLKTFLGYFIMKGPAWTALVNLNKLTSSKK